MADFTDDGTQLLIVKPFLELELVMAEIYDDIPENMSFSEQTISTHVNLAGTTGLKLPSISNVLITSNLITQGRYAYKTIKMTSILI